MVYGKSKNAKKLVLDFSFLSYSQKNPKKIGKKLNFFTDFIIYKNVKISGLVIGRANPKASEERFVQACRFAPKFSSLKGH